MSDSDRKLTVLVVDDDPDVRDLIGFVLETYARARIEYATTGREAIKRIDSLRDSISLIVCDFSMPDGNGITVFEHLQSTGLGIPFVFCSTEPQSKFASLPEPYIGYAGKPFFRNGLLSAVNRVIVDRGLGEVVKNLDIDEDVRVDAGDGLSRVHIRLLRKANVLPCDVFIRLGEEKFVRVFLENDVFGDKDLEKYASRKTDFLYIRDAGISAFFKKVMQGYVSAQAMQVEAGAQPTRSLVISQDIIGSMHDIGSRLGFTPEFEEMVLQTIELTLKVVERNPKLAELLKQIDLNHPNYVSTHSVLLSAVACWMAMRMDWNSDQTLVKLTLAAFLHDISLKDEDLARVGELHELYESTKRVFSSDEIALWREHPVRAAEIARQFSDVPPDVDMIVLHHHELPQGNGSPNHLTHSKIPPLSSLFIVAHDLVNYFLDCGTDADLKVFAARMKKKYAIGHFKRILTVVQESSAYV